MPDETQVDTLDTTIDLEATVEIPLGEIEDPQEEVVTVEQPSLSAAPL